MIPHSIGETNVSILDIDNTIGEDSYNLGVLCQSTNINKWGLYRGYVNGDTAALRLTRMQSSSYPLYGYSMGDWRFYYHPQSAPGWDVDQIGFLKADSGGGAPSPQTIGFVSLGEYSFDIEEWVDPNWVSGCAWLEIKPGTLADPDHYEVNIDGDLIGGDDILGVVYHNALIGEAEIHVAENTGALRKARIILNHPDDADGDAGHQIIEVPQAGVLFDVNPLFISFGHDEIATKNVAIVVDGGTSYRLRWVHDLTVSPWVLSPDTPAWLTVTGFTGSSETLSIGAARNFGDARTVIMQVQQREGTNTIASANVQITQELAPI